MSTGDLNLALLKVEVTSNHLWKQYPISRFESAHTKIWREFWEQKSDKKSLVDPLFDAVERFAKVHTDIICSLQECQNDFNNHFISDPEQIEVDTNNNASGSRYDLGSSPHSMMQDIMCTILPIPEDLNVKGIDSDVGNEDDSTHGSCESFHVECESTDKRYIAVLDQLNNILVNMKNTNNNMTCLFNKDVVSTEVFFRTIMLRNFSKLKQKLKDIQGKPYWEAEFLNDVDFYYMKSVNEIMHVAIKHGVPIYPNLSHLQTHSIDCNNSNNTQTGSQMQRTNQECFKNTNHVPHLICVEEKSILPPVKPQLLLNNNEKKSEDFLNSDISENKIEHNGTKIIGIISPKKVTVSSTIEDYKPIDYNNPFDPNLAFDYLRFLSHSPPKEKKNCTNENIFLAASVHSTELLEYYFAKYRTHVIHLGIFPSIKYPLDKIKTGMLKPNTQGYHANTTRIPILWKNEEPTKSMMYRTINNNLRCLWAIDVISEGQCSTTESDPKQSFLPWKIASLDDESDGLENYCQIFDLTPLLETEISDPDSPSSWLSHEDLKFIHNLIGSDRRRKTKLSKKLSWGKNVKMEADDIEEQHAVKRKLWDDKLEECDDTNLGVTYMTPKRSTLISDIQRSAETTSGWNNEDLQKGFEMAAVMALLLCDEEEDIYKAEVNVSDSIKALREVQRGFAKRDLGHHQHKLYEYLGENKSACEDDNRSSIKDDLETRTEAYEYDTTHIGCNIDNYHQTQSNVNEDNNSKTVECTVDYPKFSPGKELMKLLNIHVAEIDKKQSDSEVYVMRSDELDRDNESSISNETLDKNEKHSSKLGDQFCSTKHESNIDTKYQYYTDHSSECGQKSNEKQNNPFKPMANQADFLEKVQMWSTEDNFTSYDAPYTSVNTFESRNPFELNEPSTENIEHIKKPFSLAAQRLNFKDEYNVLQPRVNFSQGLYDNQYVQHEGTDDRYIHQKADNKYVPHQRTDDRYVDQRADNQCVQHQGTDNQYIHQVTDNQYVQNQGSDNRYPHQGTDHQYVHQMKDNQYQQVSGNHYTHLATLDKKRKLNVQCDIFIPNHLQPSSNTKNCMQQNQPPLPKDFPVADSEAYLRMDKQTKLNVQSNIFIPNNLQPISTVNNGLQWNQHQPTKFEIPLTNTKPFLPPSNTIWFQNGIQITQQQQMKTLFQNFQKSTQICQRNVFTNGHIQNQQLSNMVPLPLIQPPPFPPPPLSSHLPLLPNLVNGGFNHPTTTMIHTPIPHHNRALVQIPVFQQLLSTQHNHIHIQAPYLPR